MDFVVLARKLRPARFDELIGQDTVVRALRNAIRTDRVAHAFLFAGSRGVGKTSTARILTKALNCEHPTDGEPCNACSNCEEITRNTSPDVYEIDAASNRGIDNIRELRENTKYAPVKSRFKTYIIDEVHMLTMESFNALLKTLEEPPPHVKFVLATTNPHRIPDTILSRCQRYDFARVPVAMLADYLAQVTAGEGLTLSRPALEAIARNAAGGVRDALTAVDQVISFAGAEPSDEQVLSILGLTDDRAVFNLLGAVLDKALPDALATFAAIRERGHDLNVLLEALLREVKDFSLYCALDGQGTTFAEHPPQTLAFFAERRPAVTLDELQQLFYVLLEVEEQLKRSDFAQACFEMGLVKACRVQPLVGVRELLAQVRGMAPAPAAAQARSGASPGPAAGAPVPTPSAAPVAPQQSAPAADPAPAQPAVPGAERGAASAGPAGPPPSDYARIAARAKGRARESGAAGRGAASPSGDRGSAEDADEAEPAAPLAAASAATLRAEPPAPAAPPTGAAAGESDEPAPVPVDEGPALCDDPRWRTLVESLGAKHPRLASKLRSAEVAALEAGRVEVLAADPLNRPSEAELEAARPYVAEAFGDAFPIALNDDTNRKARPAHTIAGRNRIEEAARIAARRATAAEDTQVQRLLKAFTKARIVDIALGDAPAEPPHPNGNEDV